MRTIYKFNDGHKEYSDDHSQHWIALAIGFVVFVCIGNDDGVLGTSELFT